MNDRPQSPPAPIDLDDLTVERIQAGFARGAFTCEKLTRACLDRIVTYNPHYNAIIFLDSEALATTRATSPGCPA